MELSKSKKGVSDQLTGLVIGVVVVAIALVVGFLIFAEVGDQAVSLEGASNYSECYSYACNGTKTTQSAMDEIPGWLPIIIVTVIGAFILGLIQLFRRNA
jgi:hypothetical protein